ncbi:MAG TPA: RNA polymerase sigma factor [Terracidiphilus sp.]|nr:RNA polymerase sigma factor [Terracidiphilus sp.]
MYAPESLSNTAHWGQTADAYSPLPLSLAEVNIEEEFETLSAGTLPVLEEGPAADPHSPPAVDPALKNGAICPSVVEDGSQFLEAGKEPEIAALTPAQEAERLGTYLAASEKHRSRLLWLAKRITNSYEEAEDVVQHALLKAYVNLSKFRGDSQMSTWLGAIVQNTAREHMRSQRGKVMVSLEYAPDEEGESAVFEIPDEAKNPEECFEFQERQEIVRSAMKRMNDGHRKALQLCVLEDVPYLSAARTLNVTLSSMKSRVFRGKQLLKVAVARQLGHAG